METEDFDSEQLNESSINDESDEVRYVPFYSSPGNSDNEEKIPQNDFSDESIDDEPILNIKIQPKPILKNSKVAFQKSITSKPKIPEVDSQISLITNSKLLDSQEVPVKWLSFYNEVQNAKMQALSYLDPEEKVNFMKKNHIEFNNYVPKRNSNSISSIRTSKLSENRKTPLKGIIPNNSNSSLNQDDNDLDSSGLIESLYNNLRNLDNSGSDDDKGFKIMLSD